VRRLGSLALVALSSLSPLSNRARADEPYGGGAPTFGENPAKDYQSSQYFAFELKFGPYSPNIDSSAGLKGTPFSDLFNPQGTTGRPPGHLLTTLELDAQLFKRFGTLAIGTAVGYYRRTTHSFVYPPSATGMPQVLNGMVVDCAVPNCVRSGDETALNILPLELLLVYRFDVLALRYKVPLVPYFKIGLAYYIWWIENGGGFLSISEFTDPATGKKSSGYGGTFGWVLKPGISLLLDVLDPPAARTIDAELGINHTYVFAELNYLNIDGFGSSDKLTLSDLTWNVGLAFEF
jgi:hypothetical protein